MSYSLGGFWRGRLGRWRTRRLLEAHLVVLAVCALVAAGALFVSCRQIQSGAGAVAGEEAPAVQGLAATRLAVLRADREARALGERKFVEVAGRGETYRAQLAAADQGLSRIADRTDQDLGTVNGLLATYSNSLTLGTVMYRDQPLMRNQKLTEARSLLTRRGVGLVPRLDDMQQVQMKHAEATVAEGWLQRGGWWIAELALAALALTLLSALFVLRDRCGRDWNPYLLAAFALTVLLAVVPLLTTESAQDDLDSVIGDLGVITQESRDACCGSDLERAQRTVTAKSEEVRSVLADDTWTVRVYQGTLTGGLLIVVLPVLGLGLRLDSDYWRRR
ncbi:hypothetical protein PV383_36595 [Streptomyces caniscabiei]|uniref:Integral membrane protein n=1 Tax=Streptomyces caniscabiei TaxID=2746961 RepID=A0ABU4MYQ8_9ACTN|nr:hypothetical protein [Streptomyces sp. AMCC400023]MBE4735335.1 hypothetical protein [Streptomyces caniscabiei]MBE4754469.1 hypothetical protein [Streptomyces caniscabiei]MBE4768060.1 hypothetical protein [Streptomyces caniscabiei]MBE4789914.1 hypothetical protein [Streptomyces caniscabiei]MBE4799706.1 hypothetical protein [Streptomyces caniscabiei]